MQIPLKTKTQMLSFVPPSQKKQLLTSYFNNRSTNYGGNESLQMYVYKVFKIVSSVLMFELFSTNASPNISPLHVL